MLARAQKESANRSRQVTVTDWWLAIKSFRKAGRASPPVAQHQRDKAQKSVQRPETEPQEPQEPWGSCLFNMPLVRNTSENHKTLA